MWLQLHYTSFTTPLRYNYDYSCSTLHYIQQLWVRWPLQPLQPLQQTQIQPAFGQSVDLLCHPWFTTTNLSYRFPILKLPPPPCAVLLVQTRGPESRKRCCECTMPQASIRLAYHTETWEKTLNKRMGLDIHSFGIFVWCADFPWPHSIPSLSSNEGTFYSCSTFSAHPAREQMG